MDVEQSVIKAFIGDLYTAHEECVRIKDSEDENKIMYYLRDIYVGGIDHTTRTWFLNIKSVRVKHLLKEYMRK